MTPQEMASFLRWSLFLAILIGYSSPATSPDVATVVTSFQGHNNNVPSFGSLGEELLLSVPDDVNASYLLAVVTASDPYEGLNGYIYYSITEGRGDVFQIDENGELRVASPEKLKDEYRMDITVRAADINGTGNFTSLNVKIFIVKDRCQFVLPTSLAVSMFTEHLHDIIQELSTILGYNISLDGLMAHNKSSETDRAKKVSEKRTEIASMFKSALEKHNKSRETTMENHNETNETSLSTREIALIAVSGSLLLISLVAIGCTFRLWKSVNRQKQSEWDEEDKTNMKKDDEETNEGSIKETSSLSDVGVSSEMSVLKDVNEKPMTIEEQEQTYNFDMETKSLGLNTIARREHAIDLQMQKMQQLFQALVCEQMDSEMALLTNLRHDVDREDPSESVGITQDTDNHSANSLSSRPVKTTPEVIQRSHPEESKMLVHSEIALLSKMQSEENKQSSPPILSRKKHADIDPNNRRSSKLTETHPAMSKSSDPEISKVQVQNESINAAVDSEIALLSNVHNEGDKQRSSPSLRKQQNIDIYSTYSRSSVLDESSPTVLQISDPELSKVQVKNEDISTIASLPSTIPKPDILNEDVDISDDNDSQNSADEVTYF